MFSKSKINEPGPRQANDAAARPANAGEAAPRPAPTASSAPAATPARAKPAPSVLSADLTIKGNVETTGDVQIEGNLEGDIRAHLLTVGESATVSGEVMADEVVVNGRVIGCVRGLKVRLSATARVEGDIIHKTIAIESGAHFEGSVARRDDPLNTSGAAPDKTARGKQSAPVPSFRSGSASASSAAAASSDTSAAADAG